ncbi:FCD domain-containing protein [Nonomuraea jabiensis]|uniref:FCD domain-containing protein n=1 Tax=Nonomuraea jabiensis TaxID=882448 RepID=UPI003D732F79
MCRHSASTGRASRLVSYAADEHRAALDAICRNDPEAAADAMTAHLEASRSRLTSAYDT